MITMAHDKKLRLYKHMFCALSLVVTFRAIQVTLVIFIFKLLLIMKIISTPEVKEILLKYKNEESRIDEKLKFG
ncbi:unnamed protein product [Acanthoscelides obtectus]|uniref:Uncharacterized protein n=1 Tax=Acanthoscelides obtectus TaxID=200917 RepID=A0A9P0P4M8_ACAOB|nr:unnamed protein product [Acanthoscelides obtectus]CAK1672669.1 hypothetical protein AOBTE_LOCUS29032 [Acanthoscelides obtectus]